MSQENVELVRRIIEVWDRGDYEVMEELAGGRVAPDFELDPLYLDRVYKGDEVRQLWAELGVAWEDYRATTEEIVDLGEHVLMSGTSLHAEQLAACPSTNGYSYSSVSRLG